MPQSASRVFLNVPFDKPYEPIFIGLVGALIHLGKYPTTVLELGGGAVPRFKMPFELGLAVAVSLSDRRRPRHGFVLLESRLFRLQRSLSDMNGHDPFIQNGTQGSAIRSMVAARRPVRRLGRVADNPKRAHRADSGSVRL